MLVTNPYYLIFSNNNFMAKSIASVIIEYSQLVKGANLKAEI